MSMKKRYIKLLILVPLITLTSCSNFNYTKDANKYSEYLNEVVDAELYMPKLDELGNYSSLTLTMQETQYQLFWFTESIALFVEYDHDEYLSQLKTIETRYSFLNESIDNKIFEVSATVYDYECRIVESDTISEHYNFDYPHVMLTIGTKDNYIAYLYSYDFDLDYIKSLESFIKRSFHFVK